MEPVGLPLREANQAVVAEAIRLKVNNDQVILSPEPCAWGIFFAFPKTCLK